MIHFQSDYTRFDKGETRKGVSLFLFLHHLAKDVLQILPALQ